MAVLIFVFVWAVVNAMIASAKNRSEPGAFFCSLLVTPLLVSIYLIAVPALEKEAAQETAPATGAASYNDVWAGLFVVAVLVAAVVALINSLGIL